MIPRWVHPQVLRGRNKRALLRYRPHYRMASQILNKGYTTYYWCASVYCAVRKIVTTDGARIKCPTEEDKNRTIPLMFSQRMLLAGWSFCTGPALLPYLMVTDILRLEASMRGLHASDVGCAAARDKPQRFCSDFMLD